MLSIVTPKYNVMYLGYLLFAYIILQFAKEGAILKFKKKGYIIILFIISKF